MKNHYFSLVLIVSFFCFSSCNIIPDSFADVISGATIGISQDGNSLYHQKNAAELRINELSVDGEIESPGKIDIDDFFEREVVVKEVLPLEDGSTEFIGAYRYKGYSLFDLLNPYNQKKKNAETFRPAIDLYVIIENSKGDSVVFSWSEIFHTQNPHQIIFASSMATIEPYKNEVNYPIYETWRVVSAGDLFANRYLDDPVRITVRSFDAKEYPINRDMQDTFSPSVTVKGTGINPFIIEPGSSGTNQLFYLSSFYGMGMGYHETPSFSGPSLKEVLNEEVDVDNPEWMRKGLVVFAGIDGYRAVYSYSELFNRYDQVMPILAVVDESSEGGYYRIYNPSDFYADRSVKSLSEIFFFKH